MISGAVRSRLYELRRDRTAAQRSVELLEQKREVLLREVVRRERKRAKAREALALAQAEAYAHLRAARIELGLPAIEAAALAQPPFPEARVATESIMSVRIPVLTVPATAYRACYGAAATTESLDLAGEAFARLSRLALDLAQEETALARLRLAMRKTTKLAGALRKVVLPRIEREIREAVEAIEEEERDEAVRLRRSRP